MLIVSVLGFGTAAAIFSLVMIGGFLTFGSNCLGLVLNNYAVSDGLAGLARVAICLSLITAYPLVFLSLRRQCLDILGNTDFAEAYPATVTCLLLSGVTAVALKLHNLGTVAAFAGACFGSFLIYVAPALMAIGAVCRGMKPPPRGLRGYMNFLVQILLVPMGIVLGAVGAVQSLS